MMNMKTRYRGSERRLSPAILVLMIIGCVVSIGWFIFVLRGSLTPPQGMTQVRRANPDVEAQVGKIASRFVCACGRCEGESLDACTCETAVTARKMIQASLDKGQSVPEIEAAIESAFGGLKEEYAKQLEGEISHKVQRAEVLAHFRCPCGNCGMENLAECECDHPRGAKEVNAFLDRKLSEGKYTSHQLVAEVEKVYGARKF